MIFCIFYVMIEMVIIMIQRYDLHIHTKYSDGELDVFELLNELKENKINYFSITDHDNIDSVKALSNVDLGDLI